MSIPAGTEASVRLFVYGSLKRGQRHHVQLRGARFLGAARTAEAFALREIAGYPALVPGELAIVGELYELSPQRLVALDEFEGEAYLRQEIPLASGVKAIAYLARSAGSGIPFVASEWPARAGSR